MSEEEPIKPVTFNCAVSLFLKLDIAAYFKLVWRDENDVQYTTTVN